MTNDPAHPYHGIIGRKEIRAELLNRLGYPINPDLYAISFVQNAHACYLEVVEKDEDTDDPAEDTKIPMWKTSLTPLTPFRAEEGGPLFRPDHDFEDNLEHFLSMIGPVDFTPLQIDLYTDEVEELIREAYCRNQRSGEFPENS